MVERSLCMREARGSKPRTSTFLAILFLVVFEQLCIQSKNRRPHPAALVAFAVLLFLGSDAKHCPNEND